MEIKPNIEELTKTIKLNVLKFRNTLAIILIRKIFLSCVPNRHNEPETTKDRLLLMIKLEVLVDLAITVQQWTTDYM